MKKKSTGKLSFSAAQLCVRGEMTHVTLTLKNCKFILRSFFLREIYLKFKNFT